MSKNDGTLKPNKGRDFSNKAKGFKKIYMDQNITLYSNKNDKKKGVSFLRVYNQKKLLCTIKNGEICREFDGTGFKKFGDFYVVRGLRDDDKSAEMRVFFIHPTLGISYTSDNGETYLYNGVRDDTRKCIYVTLYNNKTYKVIKLSEEYVVDWKGFAALQFHNGVIIATKDKPFQVMVFGRTDSAEIARYVSPYASIPLVAKNVEIVDHSKTSMGIISTPDGKFYLITASGVVNLYQPFVILKYDRKYGLIGLSVKRVYELKLEEHEYTEYLANIDSDGRELR